MLGFVLFIIVLLLAYPYYKSMLPDKVSSFVTKYTQKIQAMKMPTFACSTPAATPVASAPPAGTTNLSQAQYAYSQSNDNYEAVVAPTNETFSPGDSFAQFSNTLQRRSGMGSAGGRADSFNTGGVASNTNWDTYMHSSVLPI